MSLLSSLVKSQEVVSVSPETTVAEAAKTMTDGKIGSVVVMDKGKMAGIFTERELLNRVIGKGLDPKTTPVLAVMSKEVCTISLDDTVENAFELMEKTKCRRLPITQADRVVGMVTMRNILEWLVSEMESENVQLKRYIQS
ncbi:MAG: CBS domain-containing protein [Deltaproteobacteria bacterium]|nr:CBS domain-containing protein [Deltaproteobacteria bacterium]